MTIMTTVCRECGHETDTETAYCPDCGAADPWEDQPAYQFHADDLPVVFRYAVTDSEKWALWRAFCRSYFGTPELTASDVAGLPGKFPRLKTCHVDLWWRITTDYEVEGPYLSPEAAREGDAE